MARVKKETIGIGITTHNRYEVFIESYDRIKKLAPKGAKIVVVDDASEKPCPEATFRFEENVGIAAAKNKCFELLEKCDHIFLFDDDTYPLIQDWYKPYIESPEGHLAYIFNDFRHNPWLRDTVKVYEDSKHTSWTHQRGCMLYYKKICLEVVGGMDWRFGKWGYEHPNLADRIYNAGLTSFRVMDVVHKQDTFYSGDEHKTVRTTTADRKQLLERNVKIFQESRHLKTYIDYRRPIKPKITGENVVITSFFNGYADPQRNIYWEADIKQMKPLMDSLKGKVRLVVITDCLECESTEDVTFVKVEPIKISPYYARWIFGRRWLAQHPEIGKVWFVDATDVEMINSPFKDMQQDKLYVGDENNILACAYMLKEHPAKWLNDWILRNAQNILLNAGLLGGDREIVMSFLTRLVMHWEDNRKDMAFSDVETIGESDMGIFNYIARQFFQNEIIHGRKVNTVFKRYQNTQGSLSWWKHK